MKRFVVLALALFTLSDAALAVTPYQRRLIRNEGLAVMHTCGTEALLSPEITDFKILAESGELVTALVRGVEFGPFRYEATYVYNLRTKKVVKNSIRCN